ncbi:MAG: phosphoserine phosphatase SerB [Alphaproteobacteria bacterium]|nr:phosphoserine phosphatase SerB [Alphaproteobacteria bacterium]MCW5742401.1 phosphoserine phosphatase SerB [Alphaproteobacteria bacterium]
MTHVLTLIAAPARPAIDRACVEAVARALGVGAGAATWLAEGVAVDLPFDGADASDAVRAALENRPVDAVVQPIAHRRKRLLVADMESTIIENEMLDELAEFLGLRAHIAAITARAMNGEIDFAGALRERVELLKGLPVARLGEAAQRIRYMPGARELVTTMRANGAYCALVSGGFTFFTAMVREKVGFDEDRANRLLDDGATLSGKVGEPILGKEAKLEALQSLAAALGVRLEETMAVGDGANDLPMLQAAGTGLAFHAKPAVAAAVRARIDHGDLTALLYLQGYKRSQFSR